MNKSLWIPTLIASGAALGAHFVLPASSARAQDEDEPVKDGKWHYTRQCAGCHNENGDGKGPTITQMGLQARDFKQGGFAFGDSREQMKRTITSGIPGRSPMPSFKGILADDEMELVIDYVRTLMPPRDETPPKNTEMIVKDRALIARGKLPPITEGAQEVPRGLLIGTPEGMTFEYDISDVRLLGVRLGRFANREDWGDRGGAYLRPLGSLVATYTDGSFLISIDGRGGNSQIHRRRLISTNASLGRVGLTFEVLKDGARSVALIDEVLQVETTSVGPGYTRTWRVHPTSKASDINLGIATYRTEPPWTITPIADGSACWLVCEAEKGVFDCVIHRTNTDRHDSCMAQDTGSYGVKITEEREVSATYLRVRDWTPTLAVQLMKELAR
ncbi:MAG: c-type cytochrome [Planctomycetes bacterium]|nr:c-type cytochrome [Planctomycetota bacterium]